MLARAQSCVSRLQGVPQGPWDQGVAHAASSSPGIRLELLLPQLAGCSSLLRGSRALGMGCHQTESTQVSKCHLSNHLCPADFQAAPSSAPGLVWAGCLPPTEDVHSPLSRDARAPWRVTPWSRRHSLLVTGLPPLPPLGSCAQPGEPGVSSH